MTEAGLLEEARKGDRDAFEALLAPLRESLGRFVAMMLEGENEDVIQETCTVGFRDLDRFRGACKFSTWLFGIALNLCRRELRDRARHARTGQAEALEAHASPRRGVLSSVVRHELADRIELAVGRLPEVYREVFLLRFIERLDFAEISIAAGVPAATARVRAHRARALLREEIGAVVDTIWLQRE